MSSLKNEMKIKLLFIKRKKEHLNRMGNAKNVIYVHNIHSFMNGFISLMLA